MITRFDAEREAATRALGKYLMTPQGRALLSFNGYEASQSLVPAHCEEKFLDVMHRVYSTVEPPIVLAVHYPERRGDAEFGLVRLKPTTEAGLEQLDLDKPSTTVGMFADYLGEHGGTVSLRISWANSTFSQFAMVG